MKKLRLFLFTWIVSILSIGSFANSQFVSEENINLTWHDKVISPSVIHLSVPINQVNFSLNPWWDACSVLFEKDWRRRCRVYFNVYSNPVYSQCNDEGVNFENLIWDVNVKYDARTCWDWSFSMNYTITHDSMPVSALTPAINWLHDTVWEIIPYIVYIWIWVLLAILWFYWIRRLVNRIVWKINSVFRSKRN